MKFVKCSSFIIIWNIYYPLSTRWINSMQKQDKSFSPFFTQKVNFSLPNHYFKFKLCLKVTMQLISPHPLKFSQFHITFYPVVKLYINFVYNAISLKIHCILRPNNANFVAGVQDVGGGECDQSWDWPRHPGPEWTPPWKVVPCYTRAYPQHNHPHLGQQCSFSSG